MAKELKTGLKRFHLTTHREAASPGEKQRHLAVQIRAAGEAAHCPAVSGPRCLFLKLLATALVSGVH